jgi:hypothetical protein
MKRADFGFDDGFMLLAMVRKSPGVHPLKLIPPKHFFSSRGTGAK